MISRRDALALFGLTDDASEEQIEKAIRDRLFETHPDRGGTEQELSSVLEARDVLTNQAVDASMMLVPIDHARAMLDRVEQRELLEARREHSAAVTRQLVRAEVTRLNRSRRTANLLAFVGGGATAAGIALQATNSRVQVLYSLLGTPNWPSWLTIMCGAVGTVCAVASYLVSGQIATIESAMEDASDTLTDRAAFVDTVHELDSTPRYEFDEPGEPFTREPFMWTRSELIEAVDFWSQRNTSRYERTWGREYVPSLPFRVAFAYVDYARRVSRAIAGGSKQQPSLADLARVVGPEGFTKLLLAKGEENGLLLREEQVVDGRLNLRYRLVLPTQPS